MKTKTKYLVAILFILVVFLLIGATNVNAETIKSVTDFSELKSALADSNIDVVQLANDITALDYLTFSIVGESRTRTLDLKGNTLDLGSGWQITLKNQNAEEVNFIIKSSGTTGKIIQSSNNNRPMFQSDATSANAKINLIIDGGKYEANQENGSGGFFYGTNGCENNITIKNATVDSWVLFRNTLNKISIKNLALG